MIHRDRTRLTPSEQSSAPSAGQKLIDAVERTKMNPCRLSLAKGSVGLKGDEFQGMSQVRVGRDEVEWHYESP